MLAPVPPTVEMLFRVDDTRPPVLLDRRFGWSREGVRLDYREGSWWLTEPRRLARSIANGDKFCARGVWLQFREVDPTLLQGLVTEDPLGAEARSPLLQVVALLEFLIEKDPDLTLVRAWCLATGAETADARTVMRHLRDVFVTEKKEAVGELLAGLSDRWKQTLADTARKANRSKAVQIPEVFFVALEAPLFPPLAKVTPEPEIELPPPRDVGTASPSPNAEPTPGFRPVVEPTQPAEGARPEPVFAAVLLGTGEARLRVELAARLSLLAPHARVQGDAYEGAAFVGEGATRRAVRHGLDLRRTFPSARLAVAAGVLEVLGDGASRAARGKPVEEAERLVLGLDAAAAGGLVASRFAHALVRGSFRVQEDGELEGYRVAETRMKAPSAARPAASSALPLRGRDVEMDQLLQAVEAIAAKGRRQSMTIVGPAGSGKTALLEGLRALAKGALVLSAQWEQPAIRPLGLVSALLSSGLGLRSGESTQGLGKRISDLVKKASGRDLDVRATGEAARSLVGFLDEIDKTPDGVLLPEAIVVERGAARVGRLIDALAFTLPVVVCCDDTHLADGVSLRILERAMDQTELPWLLLGATRSDEQRSEGAWLPPQHTRVTLGPLDMHALRQAVHDRLEGALAPDLATKIARRAEGSPAMADELIAWARESGRLAYRDGIWTLAGPVEPLPLPPRAQETELGRAQRVDASSRSLLMHIALVGRRAPLACVASILGAEPPQAAVETLIAAGFLRRTALGDTIEIVSDTLREALCSLWVNEEAERVLHGRIAAWIASNLPGAEHAELLAPHLERAAATGEAAKAYATAGAHAARLRRLEQARRAYAKAIELAPAEETPEKVGWRLALADIYCENRAGLGAASELAVAEQAIPGFAAEERGRLEPALALGQAWLKMIEKKPKEALAIADGLPKTPERAVLITQALQREERFADARRAGLEGIGLWRRSRRNAEERHPVVCKLFMSLAGVDHVEAIKSKDAGAKRARYFAAEKRAFWAATYADRGGLSPWWRTARLQLAQIKLELDLPVSPSEFDQHLSLSEEAGEEAQVIMYAHNVAEVLLKCHEPAKAKVHAERALALAERLGSEYLDDCREQVARCRRELEGTSKQG